VTKLPAKKRKKLARLAKMSDRRIDLSDIPEVKSLPPEAVVGKFYRPKKLVEAAERPTHKAVR
jgi:hypothetical protein